MAGQLLESTTLGFIGAGQMAEAIARGLDRATVLPASRMFAADVNAARCQVFKSFGVLICDSNIEVVQKANVLILAVKPQNVEKVLVGLKPHFTKEKLVVSIAAGINLSNLQKWAGDARIVRVMPNTPCLVGETAAAMSLGDTATEGDSVLVGAIFAAVGSIHLADEKLLNAVTGLSGSGPAYVYLAIEALADGGVAAGLPRDLSLSLAAQTVLGAAKMVVETKKHPGQLKDEVTSPAGTTIAGLRELEKAGFRSALIEAVVAAARRCEELSKS
ncbi:hypothetical protein KP509_19G079200 [Ceratopteris richardii]|uniref:Pyrroline-5-carboxylate reductase n=1 Tax=Ceratopteris richardii TaxID=49495 RepID=A0A8T2SQJ3_CERRI|nr:hypothetical protein KP509_19G079200 [Ceratopteris richardii]